MRILVLTFYYEPDLCAGSFRTTALVNELKKDDEIDVITTMPNRYGSFSNDALEYEKKDNIKIHRIKLGTHQSGFVDQSLLFTKFAYEVWKLIRKKEKYDVVYASSSRLMTAFLGSLISNKQKSKLFLDLRDIFTDTLESVFTQNKLRYVIPIFRQIEKYTIKSASHINLVSKGFEEYFMNLNSKVSYSFYSNGIDSVFLEYNFSKTGENSKKIITYAGNIGQGQGLEKIIPMMAKELGTDYEIYIIGDGGTKKLLVDSLTNVENVKLLNPVNRKELLDIYKKSDFLFLHLNDYEAFEKVLPSKVFEYGATNKFIIAGVSGYAKKFIEENISDAIVFEPCNVNDFINQFKKIEFNNFINRKNFVEKFNRVNIMKNMASKIYSL